MARKMECIFCKIIKNEIPSYKVYEDKNFLAILDIGPVNKGHVLVIPKKHIEDFFGLNENISKESIKIIQRVAKAVIKATKADGFNLMLNNKKAAGQLIDHVHFHIIPRFKKDGLKHWPQGKYKNNEAKEVLNKIKSFL